MRTLHHVRFLGYTLVLIAAFLVTASNPAAPVAAQNGSVATANGALGIMNVDVPTAGTIIGNGEFQGIGGWTTGLRVDVYLDGPAGSGEGIGTIEAGEVRPDVAISMNRADLTARSFDIGWAPVDLSAGPHTLFVYSLVDGNWVLQTVPVTGLGNLFVPVIDREGSNDETPAVQLD